MRAYRSSHVGRRRNGRAVAGPARRGAGHPRPRRSDHHRAGTAPAEPGAARACPAERGGGGEPRRRRHGDAHRPDHGGDGRRRRRRRPARPSPPSSPPSSAASSAAPNSARFAGAIAGVVRARGYPFATASIGAAADGGRRAARHASSHGRIDAVRVIGDRNAAADAILVHALATGRPVHAGDAGTRDPARRRLARRPREGDALRRARTASASCW